jgi:arylsulfatase A-like enzyme
VKDQERPFFAYIATNAPHGPFLAKPENKERFLKAGFSEEEAGFYGMVENIDENLGQLVQHLEKWQILDKTLIVFMSDNGMTGGGSGKLGKPMGKSQEGTPMLPYNAGMKGLKGSVDEGGVRVPFFVRWDGHIQPGRDVATVAAHIDVLPTFAELAGAEVPANQVEGRSLLPFLEGKQVEWEDRFLITHPGRWKTGENPDDHQWQEFAVRNERFRLTSNGGRQSLFDMQEDPGQTTDVKGQHPEIVRKMVAAYDQFWREARPLMVNETAPMSPTRPYHELYNAQLFESGIPQWQPPQLND